MKKMGKFSAKFRVKFGFEINVSSIVGYEYCAVEFKMVLKIFHF